MADFYIITNTQPTPVSVELYKLKIIDSLCENTERRHYTAESFVIRLCKDCIKGVVKELVERTNEEANNYKRYLDCRETIPGELLEDLEKKIKKSKNKYDEYTRIMAELKQSRLLSKECIVCACVVNTRP